MVSGPVTACDGWKLITRDLILLMEKEWGSCRARYRSQRMYLGFVKEVGPGPSSLRSQECILWLCKEKNKICFRITDNDKNAPERGGAALDLH